MIIKTGEVWRVDSRKGMLTIRILEDLDLGEPGTPYPDTFFTAELVEGKPKYMSKERQLMEKIDPTGPGDTLSFRTTLCTFVEKVS